VGIASELFKLVYGSIERSCSPRHGRDAARGAAAARPHTSCLGSPPVLSRVHWARPELVAEVKIYMASLRL